VLADRAAVRENFRRMRVLFFRDVVQLFEQWQINVCLDVALRARITVPIPGAAEIAAFLDDADVFDAGFAQSGGGEQSTEPTTDDDHFHFVVETRPLETGGDVRVVQIAREIAFHLAILLVAIDAHSLVSFLAVPLAQGIGIESKRASVLERHPFTPV